MSEPVSGSPERYAAFLLRKCGLSPKQVVAVHAEEQPEAILYLIEKDGKDLPRTAWLSRDKGKLIVAHDVEGFPVNPWEMEN